MHMYLGSDKNIEWAIILFWTVFILSYTFHKLNM